MNNNGINRKAYKFALKLQMRKEFPAAIIGAKSSYYSSVDKSGRNNSDVLFGKLRSKLLTIGNLYERHNGYLVGCCAEVQAANKVLFKSPYTNLNAIIFSNAIRPRTMQTIKTCKNCEITFS
ncbi:MAG: hypothetical protein V4620_03830 [Bacteroidota bacterium]